MAVGVRVTMVGVVVKVGMVEAVGLGASVPVATGMTSVGEGLQLARMIITNREMIIFLIRHQLFSLLLARRK